MGALERSRERRTATLAPEAARSGYREHLGEEDVQSEVARMRANAHAVDSDRAGRVARSRREAEVEKEKEAAAMRRRTLEGTLSSAADGGTHFLQAMGRAAVERRMKR